MFAGACQHAVAFDRGSAVTLAIVTIEMDWQSRHHLCLYSLLDLLISFTIHDSAHVYYLYVIFDLTLFGRCWL